MTLPFLTTRRIAILEDEEAGGRLPIATRQGTVTGFDGRHQQEDFWCWAAVTQSIEAWQGRSVSQSEIASHHIAPGADALVCVTPLGVQNGLECLCATPAGCGGTHALSTVLDGRNLLQRARKLSAEPLKFEADIVDRIDADIPVPFRIAWSAGGGHFVCILGYAVFGEQHWVTVYDPLPVSSSAASAETIDMPFDEFLTAYGEASGRGGAPNYMYEVVS